MSLLAAAAVTPFEVESLKSFRHKRGARSSLQRDRQENVNNPNSIQSQRERNHKKFCLNYPLKIYRLSSILYIVHQQKDPSTSSSSFTVCRLHNKDRVLDRLSIVRLFLFRSNSISRKKLVKKKIIIKPFELGIG